MRFKKLFNKELSYRKKLITIFSTIIFLFCVPYALFLYHSSKTQILNTLEASNVQNLQQIKYNYTLFTDIMSNLCFSVYLNNGTQELLYNSNISYMEATEHINYIKSTILNIYPSVYSISLYNGVQELFFSTLTDSSLYLTSLTDLLNDANNCPKLQPILRKIPNQQGNGELYVFSYILYDYKTTDNKPLSYIILEQNAGWLIENFSMINGSDQKIPNQIYLLDQNGTICSQTSDPLSESDSELVKNVHTQSMLSKNKKSFTSSIEKLHGQKYFVTKLPLNDTGDSLVMLQRYNDVFSELEQLQNTFAILTVIWIIIFIVVIWKVSNKLYAPVKKILSYVTNLSGHTPNMENEFQQLTAIYKDSYDKLAKQNTATRTTFKYYQLEKLLIGESKSAWKNFVSYAPNHWLVTETDTPIRIFRLSYASHNLNPPLADEDLKLFLFSAQNILSELLEKEYHAEVFLSGTLSIYGIMQTTDGDCDLFFENTILEMQSCIRQYLNVSFDITYSRSFSAPSQISEFYHELEQMHEYHYIYGPDAIINVQTCRNNLDNAADVLPESLIKKCISSVKHCNIQSFTDSLFSIFSFLQNMKIENTKIYIMTLVNQINFALKEMYSSKGILTRIHFEEIYSKLETAQYLEEAQLYLNDYIMQAFSIYNTKQEEDKELLFVQSIQEYIVSNYNNVNLSSQLIAEQFSLSAKYIMKRFINYSGISLNDYINEVRMNQAAILLKNSNMSVSEVASSVGILNENYFYKLFKKTYGCTPREFSSKKSID